MIVVVAAFVVYQINYAPQVETEAPVDLPPVHQHTLNTAPAEDRSGGVEIDNIKVTTREKVGVTFLYEDTLQTRFHMIFDEPQQVDDAGMLFRIRNPIITYYRKKGQKAVIRADTALITPRESGKIDPQRGRFQGNVRIDIDRRSDQWRQEHPELADRPAPQNMLVRMWMDEVDIDLELGRLQIPGRVKVESEEMLLDGEDLTIRWSEQSGLFEHLRLEHGERLVFRGGFGLNTDLAGLNTVTPAETTGETQASAPAIEPAEDPIPTPHQPAVQFIDGVMVINIPPPEPEPLEVVTYQVEFARSVRAHQTGIQSGRMVADHLGILFDMSPRLGRDRGAAEGPVATAAPPPADQPADQPTEHTGDVVLTWDGALEIRLVGEQRPLRGPRRQQLTVTGSPVVLANRDGQATAAVFVRHLESGFAQFQGAEDIPIDIHAQDLRLHATHRATFDVAQRQARLRGDVRVDLSDGVIRAQNIDASFRNPTEADRGRALEDLLDVVDCEGQASLTTAQDQIECRSMRVELGPDEGGRNIPRFARGLGQVRLRQNQRVMTAEDSVEVTFGALPENSGEGDTVRMPAVRTLLADGQVRVVDQPRNWDIRGQHLECKFDDRQEMVYGYIEGQPEQHAIVEMGEYYIEGQQVTFDDQREWVHVPGPGMVRFVVREDLDGRRGDRPVPLEIRWQRDMTLHGDRNELVFAGQTESRSKNNVLRSDTLELSLADEAPRTMQPETAEQLWFLQPFEPEVRKVRSILGVAPEDQRLSLRQRIGKRLTHILADGDAELESLSQTDGGRLESLVSLTGPQLAVDMDKQILSVEGSGRLGIQDYPTQEDIVRARQRDTDSGLFANIRSEGLSQTLIKWDSAMYYYYEQRVARFEGRQEPTLLIHRSGRHILMDQTLASQIGVDPAQLQRLRNSTLGRKTDLNCKQLLVQFEQSPPLGRRGGGEMSIGQVRQFQANGDVVLNDSDWRIQADRLDYIADTELVSVFGFERRDAYISGVDRRSGNVFEVECPEMHLELRSGSVDAPGCRLQTVQRQRN